MNEVSSGFGGVSSGFGGVGWSTVARSSSEAASEILSCALPSSSYNRYGGGEGRVEVSAVSIVTALSLVMPSSESSTVLF